MSMVEKDHRVSNILRLFVHFFPARIRETQSSSVSTSACENFISRVNNRAAAFCEKKKGIENTVLRD